MGTRRALRRRQSPAPRRAVGPGLAHSERASGGGAGGRRPEQPRHRADPVRDAQDRRGAPDERVPQARHRAPIRAQRGPKPWGSRLGVPTMCGRAARRMLHACSRSRSTSRSTSTWTARRSAASRATGQAGRRRSSAGSACSPRSTGCSPTGRGGPEMQLTFGQRVAGLEAPAFNETEVRAAAGLTMVVGAIAFSYAYFDKNYIPLQAVTTFFFIEFLIRVTVGLQASPMGLVSRWLTMSRPQEWVSAKPKRFAWTLGLGMSFSMMII